MTGLRPGSTVSRLAALALAALAAVGVWTIVVAPLLAIRDQLDAEIAITRSGNERLYAQVAATRYQRDTAILTDPTPALAARLQGQVEGIVEAAGGSIERLEATTLPRLRTSRRLDAVQLAVTFTATTAQLRQALLGLAAAPTATIVDDLSIALPPEQTEGDPPLTVTVTVRAFRSRRA